MGRIPPIAIIAVIVVLALGVSAGAFFMLIKPQQETLAGLKSKLAAEQAEAAQLDTETEELLKVEKRWKRAITKLDEARDKRSIPISFAQPVTAMVTLWPEYRKTLPELIEQFVESSGCTITSGASFPAPPNTPPPAPPSGFLQIPEGQEISLTVQGPLSSIEKLYKSLRKFPRVVTVSSLSLSAEGGTITAQVPLAFYLLAEVPRPAAPAPAAVAPVPGMEAPGMGPPGMGAPGMGAPGMGPPVGAEGMPPPQRQ